MHEGLSTQSHNDRGHVAQLLQSSSGASGPLSFLPPNQQAHLQTQTSGPISFLPPGHHSHLQTSGQSLGLLSPGLTHHLAHPNPSAAPSSPQPSRPGPILQPGGFPFSPHSAQDAVAARRAMSLDEGIQDWHPIVLGGDSNYNETFPSEPSSPARQQTPSSNRQRWPVGSQYRNGSSSEVTVSPTLSDHRNSASPVFDIMVHAARLAGLDGEFSTTRRMLSSGQQQEPYLACGSPPAAATDLSMGDPMGTASGGGSNNRLKKTQSLGTIQV